MSTLIVQSNTEQHANTKAEQDELRARSWLMSVSQENNNIDEQGKADTAPAGTYALQHSHARVSNGNFYYTFLSPWNRICHAWTCRRTCGSSEIQKMRENNFLHLFPSFVPLCAQGHEGAGRYWKRSLRDGRSVRATYRAFGLMINAGRAVNIFTEPILTIPTSRS